MRKQDSRTTDGSKPEAVSRPKTPVYCDGCDVETPCARELWDMLYGGTEMHCLHQQACKRMHDRFLGIVDGEME